MVTSHIKKILCIPVYIPVTYMILYIKYSSIKNFCNKKFSKIKVKNISNEEKVTTLQGRNLELIP